MKRTISPKDYKAWYQIWSQDSNQHIGKHFCEHFRIEDEDLCATPDCHQTFTLINHYLLAGWENDISTDNSSLSE